jgi:carboxyl-terminal processing protease
VTFRRRPARARLCAAGALLFVALVLDAPAAFTQTHRAAETFDAVWKIVRDTHFDPAFDLEQWDRVGRELRPKAVDASTPGALRAVLADMLGRLGLSHFVVIPRGPDGPGDTTNLGGQPGFDVRLIDRQLVVTDVEPDGPAAAAGVHKGWIVERIGDTPGVSMIEGIPEETPPRIAQVEAWRRSIPRLRGAVGTPLEAAFRDGSGATVVKRVDRVAEPGAPVTVGNLPTMFVRVSSSPATTPGGRKAGVIGFNVWMTAVDADFQKAVDRFRSADGIVLDLRGNPGGLAAMIMGLSGHFLSERATLGVMKTKQSELRFNANPRLVSANGERVQPYAGPLAILIDGLTGSASECFTGGLQSLGRARVFGQTSMGQALPALFDRLPNGDVLIHAWGDFVTGTGVRIEGRGVVPDEPVALSREALLEGRDLPLERALAWIDRAAAESRNSR